MICHDFIVYALSWFLHRNECKWMCRNFFKLHRQTSSNFIKLHRNERKWSKNNVYVNVWQQHSRGRQLWLIFEELKVSPCHHVTRSFNFSEKVWQHDILTTQQGKAIMSVNDLSILHRISFVKHECQYFIIVMSVNECVETSS